MKLYILLHKGEDPTKKIVNMHGILIDVEWKKGDIRRYDDTMFQTLMTADYGYLDATEGADGDKLDVYIGDHHASKRVFKLTQVKPKTGKFDELKYFVGFDGIDEARLIYLEMMPDNFFGKIEEISWADFVKKCPSLIKTIQKSDITSVGAGINYCISDKKKGKVARLPDGSGFFVGTVGKKKKKTKLVIKGK